VASRSRDIVNTGLEPCVPFPTLAMTVAHRAHGGGTVLIGSAAGTISLSSTLYAGKVEVVPSMKWTCPQVSVASQNGAGETADCSIMVAHQFNNGGIRVKPCHQRLISQKHATITQLESLYCCGRRQQYIVKKNLVRSGSLNNEQPLIHTWSYQVPVCSRQIVHAALGGYP
jgi:hypothetical protein